MEETNSTKILVVVDLQNDFVTGALGTQEAQAIVPRVCVKIRNFPGPVYYTQDTHGEDYLQTQEGKYLPVEHCIRGTWGWQLEPQIEALRKSTPIEKPTFGSKGLADVLKARHTYEGPLEGDPACGPVHGYLCHFQRPAFKGLFARGENYSGCQLLCRSHPGKPSAGFGGDESLPGGNCVRKEKGPGACPAFFVGEEKGPPKKAALGWKQNKNSKPFDLLFLVQVTGLEPA